jgi:hypothetical protein
VLHVRRHISEIRNVCEFLPHYTASYHSDRRENSNPNKSKYCYWLYLITTAIYFKGLTDPLAWSLHSLVPPGLPVLPGSRAPEAPRVVSRPPINNSATTGCRKSHFVFPRKKLSRSRSRADSHANKMAHVSLPPENSNFSPKDAAIYTGRSSIAYGGPWKTRTDLAQYPHRIPLWACTTNIPIYKKISVTNIYRLIIKETITV